MDVVGAQFVETDVEIVYEDIGSDRAVGLFLDHNLVRRLPACLLRWSRARGHKIERKRRTRERTKAKV
jgi:hypothetical protein